MLNTTEFGKILKDLGFIFYSGVPCSYLKSLINFAINDTEYVAAANEGDAVAIAAGAYLGGKKSVVLMQNSGLTNAISPLTSLNYTFKIPVLGFVSLRGEPGLPDEPQHELLGQITSGLLKTIKIKHAVLSSDIDEAKKQISKAAAIIDGKESFFFIVKKGTFDEIKLKKNKIVAVKNEKKVPEEQSSLFPKRIDVLKVINNLKNKDSVFIASTGYIGRELYQLDDSEHNLYMVGSMGCASSIGLGLSLTKPDKNIVVIDGDGALLMRMGSMATNGSHAKSNMLHILLDNSCHESTGAQNTASSNVNFVEIAAACGYSKAFFAHDLKELGQFLKEWMKNKGLTFIHIKIVTGTIENLGRPKITPVQVKERLMKFIGSK